MNFDSNLKKLDLSGQLNGYIPGEIFELVKLKKLTLSNCNIKELPIEISKLKSLELLDLSNNSISNLYAKLFELRRLKTLILNNNNLPNLPKQIGNLKKLRILGVSNNRLDSLPESIANLINLEEVNLFKNNFKKFPMNLLKINKLKRLWIGNNEFNSMPISEIVKLPSMEAIYCFSSSLNSSQVIDESYIALSKIKGNSFPALISLSNKMINKRVEIKNELRDKTRIFISYAHDDNNWVIDVKKHLRVLKLQDDRIEVWDDTMIKPGEDWKKEIEKSLEICKIAILMISTNFLASKFIINNELPQLLKSAESKGTLILPLIIAPCRFLKNDQLNIFQAVNDPTTPLSELTKSRQDMILVKLVDEIEKKIG